VTPPESRDGPVRPPVRINQLGYLPAGPKRATVVTSAPVGLAATVRDAAGHPVWTGRSRPWPVRPEPTSGLVVHVVDFTGVGAVGSGFTLDVAGRTSHPFRIADDLYAGLAVDALRFFYLQRSGCPIEEDRAPGYGRPAGHVGVPPNRGDTAVPAFAGSLYPDWVEDGCFDVSGGWYDAGDHGKYVTSGALPVWQLPSTLELLREPGTRAALVEECRWQLDWLLRMQVPTGHRYAEMAFHRVHGTEWAPLPMWPHRDPTRRVLHRPSTAATLALAAVAAHASRVLRADDPRYADRLLAAAVVAHTAARTHPPLLAPDDRGAFGGGPYDDDDLDDDRYWAAAELWLASGDTRYRDELRASPLHASGAVDLDGFDSNLVTGPALLDLALVDSALPERDRLTRAVLDGAERMIERQRRQPWGQPYAPETGWHWGSNGRVLNNLVVIGAAHRLSGAPALREAFLTGLDYLLGRNALGQCYITGYGTDDSHRQRTRHFAHDLDPAFPPPPPGAIAGGPTDQDHPGFPSDPRIAGLPPQLCYFDAPTSETTNDICIRWNAPLVAVAVQADLLGRGQPRRGSVGG
jgi:endoglucanase